MDSLIPVLSILLSPDVSLYFILFSIMVVFVVFEAIAMMTLGVSSLDALGSIMHFDITLPDFIMPKSSGAPFSFWLACVTVGFAISGLCSNIITYTLFGHTLPLLYSVPLSLITGILLGRLFLKIFRVIPLENSSAISSDELRGSMGALTFIRATADAPAEAKVVDKYGQAHYIRVRPVIGEPPLELTDRIFLVSIENGVWFATKL